MKSNKIIGALLGVVIGLGAWSCTDEVEYKPTEPTTTDEVYFSKDQSTDLSIALDATEVEVKINRLRADDDLTVQLEATSYYLNAEKQQESAANVFAVPSSVTFAKGENEATIRVGVTFSEVVAARDYYITIKIDDPSASLYGDVEETFKASYEPWTDWAQLSELGNFQQAGMWDYNYDNYVYYRKSLVNPNLEQYAIGGPFSDFEYDYVMTVDRSHPIEIEGEACYFVTMETIETPLTNSGGAPYLLSDVYTWFSTITGNTDYDRIQAMMADSNLANSYFNPVRGLIAINQVRWATNIDPGNAYSVAYNYLQLGGYADYFIDFSKVYNIVDEYGTESVVLQAYKSDDVYSYAYTVTPGALDDAAIEAEVAAIKANSEATLYTETQRYFTYTPEAEGDYTIVAVGYNQANEEVYHTAYTFNFTTVKAESDWEPAGRAAYTDGFLYCPYAKLTDDGWQIQVGGDQWMVDIERNKTNPNLIRMVNPYNSKNWNNGYEGWDLAGNYYVNINIEDPDGVYIEESQLGIQLSPNDGPINVSSFAYDFLKQGYSIDQVKQVGIAGTLKDGKITFPGASLLIEFQNDPGFMYTNWDFEIPVYTYDEAGKKTFNLMGQLQGTGWFELDLNGSSITPAPKKSHPAEIKVQRNPLAKSPYKSRIAAAGKVEINELMKANFEKTTKYLNR